MPIPDDRIPARLTAPTPQDRRIGALVGLAVGDALGTTVEFQPPGSFAPLTDMIGGGPFRLPVGAWTDDTSMALCLAESLVECGGFDPEDQMRRYVAWWRHGTWSSTGRCFDIGTTTRTALATFERTGQPYAGSIDPMTAGNGSLMRLAPVVIYRAGDPAQAIEDAAASSRTTHAATECVDACRYCAGLLVGAMRGDDKDTLLSPGYAPIDGLWDEAPLTATIADVAAGSFLRRQPPEIAGTGHVVKSLEAALWAFASTDDFRSGALAAVNLGDDADTTGAIYGQIAGAFYGAESIPRAWRDALVMRDEIHALARALAVRSL